MDTIIVTGTGTFTSRVSKVFRSRVMSIFMWSADTLNAIHCGPAWSPRQKTGRTDRFIVGVNVPSQHRKFSHRGRFHGCEIGSNGSMIHFPKRNWMQCERLLIVDARMAMRRGLTKSPSDKDCGTHCVQSDAQERRCRRTSEKDGKYYPRHLFRPARAPWSK